MTSERFRIATTLFQDSATQLQARSLRSDRQAQMTPQFRKLNHVEFDCGFDLLDQAGMFTLVLSIFRGFNKIFERARDRFVFWVGLESPAGGFQPRDQLFE